MTSNSNYVVFGGYPYNVWSAT